MLERIRQRVEARRAAGEYPPGLEYDLDRHYRSLRDQRRLPTVTVDELRAGLHAVEAASRFDLGQVPDDSRVPGGAALHRAVGRAVQRQLAGVVDQLRGYTEAVQASLGLLVDAADDPPRHVHADLAGQLAAIEERLAAIERRLALEPDPYLELVGRVNALERRAGASPDPG